MNLSDRMKMYEKAYDISLPRRLPVIVRIDGKAFHTVTKKMEKPFDKYLNDTMVHVTTQLVCGIDGCRLGYHQSDEISLLLINYNKFDSEAWFDNSLQKIASVSASMATKIFANTWGEIQAMFDARRFVLPENEVYNYFLWRQQDWIRNSVQMLAHSLYSHRELVGKSTEELHDMCFVKGYNWNDLWPMYKNGTFVDRHTFYNKLILKDNKDFMDKYLEIEDK